MKRMYIWAGIPLFLLACQSDPTNQHADPSGKENSPLPADQVNSLSEEEINEGWQPLFDGVSTQGWHVYLTDNTEGWTVENGVLATDGEHGDLVTDKDFDNFELSLEWKVSPEGNSGIFYLINEDPAIGGVPESAPEYQIIDDENYPSDLAEVQLSGANYALHAPTPRAAKPAGEWNTARIVVNQGKVEHWLNGQQVVSYELWTEAWKAMVAETKFKDWPAYGQSRLGKIGLQGHGDPVSFRNIKVKSL